MPTYRVYIRKPTTHPPIWDWAETIVRNDQQTAINDSYQHWVESLPPTSPPPPLAQCQSQAVQK